MEKITNFKGDYYFLNNFYPCEVVVLGFSYKSSEAAYMASKTLDLEIRKLFQNLTASEAKKLGRKLTLRPDWDIVSLEMMELALRSKFMRNEDLKNKLISTGNAHLEEGNTWGDTKWGTCNGKGQNLLGKLLMNIREDLIK